MKMKRKIEYVPYESLMEELKKNKFYPNNDQFSDGYNSSTNTIIKIVKKLKITK